MYGTVDKQVEIYKVRVESNVIDDFGIEHQCINVEKPECANPPTKPEDSRAEHQVYPSKVTGLQ